jgi:hypothetical protein
MFLYLFFFVLAVISFVFLVIDLIRKIFQESDNSTIMFVFILMGMFLGYIFL